MHYLVRGVGGRRSSRKRSRSKSRSRANRSRFRYMRNRRSSRRCIKSFIGYSLCALVIYPIPQFTVYPISLQLKLQEQNMHLPDLAKN